MENPRNHAADTILVIFTVLTAIMGFSLWVIFESGSPFFIRLIFAFVFLVFLLFAITSVPLTFNGFTITLTILKI